MPANWISERPTTRRRSPAPEEAQRLQLPLHRPQFENARPRQKAEPAEQTKRGVAVLDFYI